MIYSHDEVQTMNKRNQYNIRRYSTWMFNKKVERFSREKINGLVG